MVQGPEHELQLSSKPEEELDRTALLEEAIRRHRFSVGRGYHYHSFKSVYDANMALWEMVTDRSVYSQDGPDTPTLAQ